MNWEPIKQGFASVGAQLVAFHTAHPVIAGTLMGFIGGFVFCLIVH